MSKQSSKPLQRQHVNFKAWAEAHNIYFRKCQLDAKFWGYVFKSLSGAYLIIISSSLTREMQNAAGNILP